MLKIQSASIRRRKWCIVACCMFLQYLVAAAAVAATCTITIRMPYAPMGSWNMQGATGDGNNKYAAAVGLMNAYYNQRKMRMERKSPAGRLIVEDMDPLELLALQEAGPVPASAVYNGKSHPANCRGDSSVPDCISEYEYSGFYLYHMPVDADEPGKRTNLAILARNRASKIVLHPRVYNENGPNPTLANRAVFGIKYEVLTCISTYFYTFHAGSFGPAAEHKNNVDPVMRSITNYHAMRGDGTSADGESGKYENGWAVAGDYNRDPRNHPNGVIEGVLNTGLWGYAPVRMGDKPFNMFVYTPNTGTKTNGVDRMLDYVVATSSLWGFTGWRVPALASLSDHYPITVQGSLKARGDTDDIVQKFRANQTACAQYNKTQQAQDSIQKLDISHSCKAEVEKKSAWWSRIPLIKNTYDVPRDYKLSSSFQTVTCRESHRQGATLTEIVESQIDELAKTSACPSMFNDKAIELSNDAYKNTSNDEFRRRLRYDEDHTKLGDYGFRATKIDHENVFIRKSSGTSSALITTLWSTGRANDVNDPGRLDKLMVQVPYDFKDGEPTTRLAFNFDIVGGKIVRDPAVDDYVSDMLSSFGLSKSAFESELDNAARALVHAGEHILENGIEHHNIDLHPWQVAEYYVWAPASAEFLNVNAVPLSDSDPRVRVRVYDNSNDRLLCDERATQPGHRTYCNRPVTGGRFYKIALSSPDGVHNATVIAAATPTYHGISPDIITIPNISAPKWGKYAHSVFYYSDGRIRRPLSIRTRGGAGKVTLYVNHSYAPPTVSDFDCRDVGSSTETECYIPNPFGGIQILVQATEAISGVTLEIRE